jgi:hypothetical protein
MSADNPHAPLGWPSPSVIIPADPTETIRRLIDDLRMARELNAIMLAALKRLVADYEDVPDPTDADGQAVFNEARAAIAKAESQ